MDDQEHEVEFPEMGGTIKRDDSGGGGSSGSDGEGLDLDELLGLIEEEVPPSAVEPEEAEAEQRGEGAELEKTGGDDGQHPNDMEEAVLTAICPPGVCPGELVEIETEDGLVTVVVPDGVGENETFEVATELGTVKHEPAVAAGVQTAEVEEPPTVQEAEEAERNLKKIWAHDEEHEVEVPHPVLEVRAADPEPEPEPEPEPLPEPQLEPEPEPGLQAEPEPEPGQTINHELEQEAKRAEEQRPKANSSEQPGADERKLEVLAAEFENRHAKRRGTDLYSRLHEQMTSTGFAKAKEIEKMKKKKNKTKRKSEPTPTWSNHWADSSPAIRPSDRLQQFGAEAMPKSTQDAASFRRRSSPRRAPRASPSRRRVRTRRTQPMRRQVHVQSAAEKEIVEKLAAQIASEAPAAFASMHWKLKQREAAAAANAGATPVSDKFGLNEQTAVASESAVHADAENEPAAADDAVSRLQLKLEALKQELSALKLRPLMKRAEALGIDEEKLEDAAEAENSKEATIALVIARIREEQGDDDDDEDEDEVKTFKGFVQASACSTKGEIAAQLQAAEVRLRAAEEQVAHAKERVEEQHASIGAAAGADISRPRTERSEVAATHHLMEAAEIAVDQMDHLPEEDLSRCRRKGGNSSGQLGWNAAPRNLHARPAASMRGSIDGQQRRAAWLQDYVSASASPARKRQNSSRRSSSPARNKLHSPYRTGRRAPSLQRMTNAERAYVDRNAKARRDAELTTAQVAAEWGIELTGSWLSPRLSVVSPNGPTEAGTTISGAMQMLEEPVEGNTSPPESPREGVRRAPPPHKLRYDHQGFPILDQSLSPSTSPAANSIHYDRGKRWKAQQQQRLQLKAAQVEEQRLINEQLHTHELAVRVAPKVNDEYLAQLSNPLPRMKTTKRKVPFCLSGVQQEASTADKQHGVSTSSTATAPVASVIVMRRKNEHRHKQKDLDTKVKQRTEHQHLKAKLDQLERENQVLNHTRANVMVLKCPEGVSSGQIMIASAPSGEEVEIEIPSDVRPGDEFEIDLGVEVEADDQSEGDDDVDAVGSYQIRGDAAINHFKTITEPSAEPADQEQEMEQTGGLSQNSLHDSTGVSKTNLGARVKVFSASSNQWFSAVVEQTNQNGGAQVRYKVGDEDILRWVNMSDESQIVSETDSEHQLPLGPSTCGNVEEKGEDDVRASSDGMSDVEVVVPQGMGPGDVLTIELDDGTEFEVEIPEGLAAGDEFDISIDTCTSPRDLKTSAAPSEDENSVSLQEGGPNDPNQPAATRAELTTYIITLEKPVKGGFGINITSDCNITSFSDTESCAFRGGVKKDSTVLEVNGRQVRSRAEIISIIQYLMPGDCATFLLRGAGPGPVHKDEREVAMIEYFDAISCRFVELGGLVTDGIFREVGSSDAVSKLQAAIDATVKTAVGTQAATIVRDVLSSHSDVHDIATFLGRWLREQPVMIAPHNFRKCHALLNSDADGAACDAFVKSHLSSRGGSLLRSVVGLLQQIDEIATQMPVDNLSKAFASAFIQRKTAQEIAKHVATDAAFVSLLIERLPPSPTRPVSRHGTVDLQTDCNAALWTEPERVENQDDNEFADEEWDEARAGDALTVSRRMQNGHPAEGESNSSVPGSLVSVKETSTSSSSSDDESKQEFSGLGDEFAALAAMLDSD